MYYSLKNDLRYNGKVYQCGEKIDLRTGIRDQRVLNTMIRMRKVRIGVDAPAANEPLAVVDTDTTLAITDDPLTVTATDGDAEIVHNGGGYYKVMLSGIELSAGVTLKGKEAAEQWSKENGVS